MLYFGKIVNTTFPFEKICYNGHKYYREVMEMYELFNDGWFFAANIDVKNVNAFTYLSGFKPVTLPHDYQITLPRNSENSGSQGFWPHNSTLTYIKAFNAPENWQGKQVTLCFDGAQRFSNVYLNGELVGGHRYGYVPFEAELTAALKIGGENKLVVTLDNTDIGDRWYSGMGIYRNVNIRVTEDCRIAQRGLRMRHTMNGADADVHATVDVENFGGECAVTVRLSVADVVISRDVSAKNGCTREEFDFCVHAPAKWDVDDVNLYELKCELLRGNEVIDENVCKVGFREAYFDDDKGFILNGRGLKMKGVDLHHDGGVFGAAVPVEIWRRRFEKLKAMGCNAIRCSHNPQAAEFYDLADELGFVVIDELYDKWDGTRLYYEKIFPYDRLDDLDRMIGRDINHPSIVLWSVGNEVEIQYSEKFYEYLSEMCAACRAADPSRGVSMALISYCLKDFNENTDLDKRLMATVRYGEIVDVFMGNYMESFYRALRDKGLKKAFIGSEILSYYRFEDLSNTTLLPIMPWNDVEDNEWVAGGFVWAGIDYLGESNGWPVRGWTGCPVDSAGFYKTRAYHLMSRWQDKPMVKFAVFDESEGWDMANSMWGFPALRADWNQNMPGRVYHVGVFTNCDEVRLTLNGGKTRVARPDNNEHIASFYVVWQKGEIVVEGVKDGEVVCTERIVTTDKPEKITLESIKYAGSELVQVEAMLLDEADRAYLRSNPHIDAAVEGNAEIIAIANGDHLAISDEPRFYNGHALIVVRKTGAGDAKLTVSADGITAETII